MSAKFRKRQLRTYISRQHSIGANTNDVRSAMEFNLGQWIRGLKRSLGTTLTKCGSDNPWQPGFFDHLLRNSESYDEKWEYVRNNPLRAGLANSRDDWPYQGEIVSIDRA